MHITFRQLEIFIKIMDIGSTAQAAKKLCMSQPAVSTALSALENQLSVKLFDRGNKKLTPNKNGMLFYPKALTLLSQASSIENIFNDKEIKIKFASGELFSTYILPSVLKEFSTSHKKVSIFSCIRKDDETIKNVINGTIDIATITKPYTDSVIKCITLSKKIVMSIFTSRQLSEKISLENISKVTWVLGSKSSGLWELSDNPWSSYLAHCPSIIEFDNIQAIKNTVKLGLGVGCLPLISIEDELQSEDMKEIYRWDGFNFNVIYNKGKVLSKEEYDFIEGLHHNSVCNLN